jgi:hypothetical protein
MEMFRPFLSYDELGALFAEQSKLHDALGSVLGLDQLDDALDRLAVERKRLIEPEQNASRMTKQLRPLLQELDDNRAAAALAQIKRQRPDLTAVRDLVTGKQGTDESGRLTELRTLAALSVPRAAELEQAAVRYRKASGQLLEAEAQVGAVAARKSALLEAALALHEETGDGPCAVCGQGTVDAAWAERAQIALDESRRGDQVVAAAQAAVSAATRALTAVVQPVPAILCTVAERGDPGAAQAVERWQAWHAATSDPVGLSAGGVALLTRLSADVTAVTAAAAAELSEREDAWQPLAVQLAEWLRLAESVESTRGILDDVKAAETWLKDHAHDLRNERIRALADRARHIWSLLRQESSVDLGEITMEGTRTRRRLALAASVDGTEAGALSVMSQGELHALALSLFLPKASSPSSPFGFVIIDDPVQAMDPAKVDGLARVLAEVAGDRQVIVFTHDDRLPEAVRRLGIDGRLVEVTRDEQSVVTVTDMSNPARRYLDDARAISHDPQIPDDIRRRAIAQLCRSSLESACHDAFYAARFQAGINRHDVEQAWMAATTTRGRVALVVHGDPSASLDSWLARSRHRPAALGICTSAPHQGVHGNPRNAIDDVTRLVAELADIRAG